jgi:hypothetical protein
MAFHCGPRQQSIVTDGITLRLDAANSLSYPGTGTTWTDLSINNYNGTLTNGPTYSSANEGSIVFDGINDYVLVPGLSWTPTSFSVFFFIKPGASYGYNNQITSTNGWGGFVFHTDSELRVWCGINIATRFEPAPSGLLPIGILQLNVYQMFCFTYSSISGTGSFYKNSSLIATKSMTNPTAWTGGFRIGTSDANTVNGNIPIMLIYNKELSVTEVQQNYNALKNRYGL